MLAQEYLPRNLPLSAQCGYRPDAHLRMRVPAAGRRRRAERSEAARSRPKPPATGTIVQALSSAQGGSGEA